MALQALARATATSARRAGRARLAVPATIGGRSRRTSRPRRRGCWRCGRARDGPAHHAFVRHSSADGARTRAEPARSPDARRDYPGLAEIFSRAPRACSARPRTCRDCAPPTADTRPWLRHAAWPRDYQPLVDPRRCRLDSRHRGIDDYEFVRVEGDGVHEIPVGPVHAGIIEPGHFRFSIVGEKVLRARGASGYVHKGIERRFTQLPHSRRPSARGARLGRFGRRVLLGVLPGARGHRAHADSAARPPGCARFASELERIANHLGDLGALGNDAGFAFGLAQFSRLKEQLLRATATQASASAISWISSCRAERAHDLARRRRDAACASACRSIAHEALTLRAIYDEHAGVRDRFVGAGTVAPELAAHLGLTGLAGRASGQAFDLRIDLPCEPYAELAPAEDRYAAKAMSPRASPCASTSCRNPVVSCSGSSTRCRAGLTVVPVPGRADGALGVGLDRRLARPGASWRSKQARTALIRRCHPHDPSWQNWPVLEHAIIGNIVPDFPLINKSFNLSYSGHDL